MRLFPSRTASLLPLFGACLLLILVQFNITHAEDEAASENKVLFGRITEYKGDVSVNKKPVRRGMSVFYGDIVSTGAGKVRIENHSSYFIVGPLTEVVLSFPRNTNNMGAHIDMNSGTLRSVINKLFFPSFEVETPTTLLGVRGTDFLVHSTQKASVVFTKEGAVSFSADGKTVLVNKMEMAQAGEKIAPLEPEKILSNKTLTALLREVEQFCDLEIPPSLSSRKELNNIIARWNLNYAAYLVDKKEFEKAKKLCSLAFFIADLRTLKAEAILNKGTISFTFMGEQDAALKDLDEIIKNYADTSFAEQALYFKGLIYYHQNDVNSAKKVLKQYIKEYPEGKFKENALAILQRLSGR